MADDHAVSHDSGFRWVTVSYLVALGIIAVLVLGTHFLADAIIKTEGNTAYIVNLAGRQRMLSQRVGRLALELSHATGSADSGPLEEELSKTLAAMESAHETLLRECAIMPGLAKTVGVAASDGEKPIHLEARIEDFLAQSRSLLKLPAERRAVSPELARVLEASRQSLLQAFEETVATIQAESEQAIARLRRNMVAMLSVMLATLAVEALFIFRPLFHRLKAAQAKLLEVAMTDPLTGSMNRRHLMESAESELRRARRTGRPMAVMMLDIDKFKFINDRLGHGAGDEAIVGLARTLAGAVRANDQVGRLGGDEFAIVLPETDAENALVVAERLRTAVASMEVVTSVATLHMTISIGIAEASGAPDTISALFDRADQALYQAKKSGRDRVCCWRGGLDWQTVS